MLELQLIGGTAVCPRIACLHHGPGRVEMSEKPRAAFCSRAQAEYQLARKDIAMQSTVLLSSSSERFNTQKENEIRQ